MEGPSSRSQVLSMGASVVHSLQSLRADLGLWPLSPTGRLKFSHLSWQWARTADGCRAEPGGAVGGPGRSHRAGNGARPGGILGQWRLQVHSEGSPAKLSCGGPAHVLHQAGMWVEAEEHGRRPPVGSCPHGSPFPICLFFRSKLS
jgi:hypothetical protein